MISSEFLFCEDVELKTIKKAYFKNQIYGIHSCLLEFTFEALELLNKNGKYHNINNGRHHICNINNGVVIGFYEIER